MDNITITFITSKWLELLDFLGLPRTIEGMVEAMNTNFLNLSHKGLESLPEWVGLLPNLKELHVSGNQLTVLPEWLGQLTNLRYLEFSSNGLSSLPESLRELPNLKYLDVSHNLLTVMPTGFRAEVSVYSSFNLF